jgi:hypothetical protein
VKPFPHPRLKATADIAMNLDKSLDEIISDRKVSVIQDVVVSLAMIQVRHMSRYRVLCRARRAFQFCGEFCLSDSCAASSLLWNSLILTRRPLLAQELAAGTDHHVMVGPEWTR